MSDEITITITKAQATKIRATRDRISEKVGTGVMGKVPSDTVALARGYIDLVDALIGRPPAATVEPDTTEASEGQVKQKPVEEDGLEEDGLEDLADIDLDNIPEAASGSEPPFPESEVAADAAKAEAAADAAKAEAAADAAPDASAQS